MLRRVLSIALAVGMSAMVCAARNPGDPLKPGFNLFSKQQDVQLGQEASQQVLKQYKVVQNPFLQDYLKTIGRRLASTPEAAKSGFPFTFTLVNDSSVNAFALPGGPMFVFTGLLKAVDNEAELAGVMAHEMSHVILRHGTNQASKANLIQLPAMLAGAVVGNGSMLGQLAQLGIGLGANSVLLKYSRDAESQADALGSHLMAEAGYNPIEMAHFFEKLQSQGGGGGNGIQFLSDHPNPGNRVAAVEAEIRTQPQREYGFETGEFQRAKSELGRVPAAPAKGIRGSATPPASQPSGGMREARSQYFSVSYPDNWEVYGDQGSGSLTIAPREGLVQGSNGATQVGYGAILSYFNPEQDRNSLSDATDDLIHHLHADNPGMQVTNSARRTRVAGAEGLVTTLSSASPYGGDETDTLLTVSRPEGLFYAVLIAPSREYARLRNTFDKMLSSIRFNS